MAMNYRRLQKLAMKLDLRANDKMQALRTAILRKLGGWCLASWRASFESHTHTSDHPLTY